ncbi:MAG TPA: branched-chain amino acid ABC transporter permease [Hyphomicrobiaceae bacterium]|jgi:branched-chain amino acid transport system permease protein|nr:branched-chain amino acid ABC transporter permease [Hyphomicrobiaceae bacterium]
MLRAILSDDLPRSRLLSAVLLAIVLLLALAPLLFGGAQAINTAAKICVFIVLVASYDLLLGYTGIVSFAHTMFYGLGGYGVGLALYGWGASWTVVGTGLAIAIITGIALAFLIGLFSLRVRAIFFAMITLAVASAFAIMAAQFSEFTGGEDGRSFRVPELLRPAYTLTELPIIGAITGRTLAYYLVFVAAVLLFLAALRIVNSPFGRVLQAIRENDFRAEALGYRTVGYRIAANCIAAAMAVLAGGLNALWLRYTGPDTTLSFSIMVDILLMVVIGGMGTMYGAVLGASLFVLAQNYLQKLMATAAQAAEAVPVIAQVLHPDRWLLWLGILFVLSVYFFPAGIVGKLRQPTASGS